MDIAGNFFSHFVQPDPKTALLVVLNLIVIESLLSVDNAAVLATMVMNLPDAERKKALRIGILFAYIFRGLALVFASLLIKINWLKLAGGAYLIYLCIGFFYEKLFPDNTTGNEPGTEQLKAKRTVTGLNIFWSTVVMVELMDLTFSIDNVFAAVAFTKNIYLVCLGVFIGIITMRIVAGYFVQLMEKFPFLDILAFTLIGILGLRLCFDFMCSYFPENPICNLLHNEQADMYFSIGTSVLFFLPLLSSWILGYPKRK